MDNVLLISFCWKNQYLHQHSLTLTELRKLDVKCKSILIPDRINLLYREYKTSILYTYCSTQYTTLALGRLLFACLAFTSNLALGFCWLKQNITLEQIFHPVNVYSMQSFLCIFFCHLLRLNHAPPSLPHKNVGILKF